MYAIDARVVRVMPWIRALPERVALGSRSTELGEVNTYLKACCASTTDENEGIGPTYANKNVASQKTIPWILRIVAVTSIKEDRPLISGNSNLSGFQLLLDAAKFKCS
jgi:hypothetical protein